MNLPGITFVCARQESGQDGVGDYTRILALLCREAGVAVAVVALNDQYVTEPRLTGDQGFPLLRLPGRTDWAENVSAAAEFVSSQGLEWVSFQFVPYSYGRRGLVWGLAEKVRPLTEGRKLQLMFHETWIGATEDAGIKGRVVGWLQRAVVKRFVARSRPQLVHTSNPAYVHLLEAAGVRAQRLPLPSTIPWQPSNASSWLWPRLARSGVVSAGADRENLVVFGFFGTLHFDWPADPLLGQLEEFGRTLGKQVLMLSFGKLGAGEPLWDRLKAERTTPMMSWCKLGLLSPLEASQVMNSIDFGVAASPLSLLEKSSAAVCMLEHGLPLVVNRNDARFTGIDPEAGMHELCIPSWRADFIDRLRLARRRPGSVRGSQVARQFLASLGFAPASPGPLSSS